MKVNPFIEKLIILMKESDTEGAGLSVSEMSVLAQEAKKNNFPVYSILVLLREAKENVNKQLTPEKMEGWVFVDNELSKNLKKRIIEAVAKGKLTAKDKDIIYNEALKEEVLLQKVDLFINKELEAVIEKQTSETSKKNKFVIALGLTLSTVIIGLFLYFQMYKPYLRDKNAMRRYVVANNLNLRSTLSVATKSNIIAEIPYGTEVIVYSMDKDWATVKVNEKEGYMGMPYKYLIEKKEFYEIDGLFGNKEARELLKNSAEKKAVLNYLLRNNLSSNIPEKVQLDIYGQTTSKNVWQFFGLSEGAAYNTIAHGNFLGSIDLCMAIVIKDIMNEDYRLLVFQFGEDERDSLIYESSFDRQYEGIQSARKNNLRFQGEYRQGRERLTKLKLDGIEFGINNDFRVYKKKLLIYTGYEGFKEYLQPNN